MKVPLYGYKFKEFWTDIGTLDEYRRAQEIVGDRRIETPPKGECIKPGIWVGVGTHLPKDVKLKAPCSIGENCRIEPNTIIGPYSFIGNRCIVGQKSVILRSILWDHSLVSDGVKLQGAILISKKVVPPYVAISGGLILDDKDFKEN